MNGNEAVDLIKAWLAISLAFGIILYSNNKSIAYSIIAGLLIVGVSFVIHELAHRTVARKYGKHAEFKANNKMLVVAVVSSLFGFIIAAPGAVHVSGFVDRRKAGIIAASGPLANIVIAIVCIPLLFVIPTLAFFGLYLNSLLAIFNLIPFRGFDGQKVLGWNKAVYSVMAALSVILLLTFDILPRFVNL